MKLGTKIILGFMATCLIFVVLSIYIIVSMLRVERSSLATEKEVMPTLNAATSMQYAVAIEGLFTVDFSYSSNRDSWDTARRFTANNNEYLSSLKDLAATGSIRADQKVVDFIKALEVNYGSFNKLNESLPPVLESINQLRARITANDAAFTKGALEFLSSQEQLQLEEIRQGSDMATAQRRSNRISEINQMVIRAGHMVSNMQRGVLDRSPDHFDRALADGAFVVETLTRFEGDIRNPQTKEFIIQLKGIAQDSLKAMESLKSATVVNIRLSLSQSEARDRTLVNARELGDAMRELNSLTVKRSSAAVRLVVWSLIIGLVVALAVSVILGLLIARSITGPINSFIRALSEGAKEVDLTAGHLTGSSNTLADGATENAASLEQTRAALEELSSMTARNADGALTANELMGLTNEAMQTADESLKEVVRAMVEISDSGGQIEKIINTIDDIAFQTNLLSLNASVEAARAGEAGAGFAVVADEVRNLAIRSAEAARSTAELVASTINNIRSGSELVSSTAENFKEVEEQSAKVTGLLSEVSDVSRQQAQGIAQITSAMVQIDNVTQSNAASAEESASAAGELSQQAASLLEAVEALNGLVHGQKTLPIGFDGK
ncbi:hypothetical protein C4J81_08670 [Deltaproteobacteria bacterium Smac51]|nr:hypothetical protein C4J81_08670 [Deltaproteobacteria bacterium Smac51]